MLATETLRDKLEWDLKMTMYRTKAHIGLVCCVIQFDTRIKLQALTRNIQAIQAVCAAFPDYTAGEK